MSAFVPGTPAADALSWLEGLSAAAGSASGAGTAPAAGVTAAGGPGTAAGAPFLSVLVRTQGTRPATLADTLLTLAGQTCDSFEILVLAHDPAEGVVAAIEQMVGEFHSEFAQRVRVLAVHGGNRSRPLNEGARHARGWYLAMMDDDDLAFAHWVATFREAAERAPGHVARACVAIQCVRSLPGAWGETDGYETLTRPHVEYPLTFDYLDHLVDNRTPNNGYAVARAAVLCLGLGWDETLPVLEDWDHLMRAVALCGVESAPTVSALLRSWSGATTSKTAHSEEEWADARRRIEARHTATPVLLQRGAAAQLRARAVDDAERARLALGNGPVGAGSGVAALQRALADAEAQLAAIRSSTTWRAGRAAHAALSPLRRLAAWVLGARGGPGPGASAQRSP